MKYYINNKIFKEKDVINTMSIFQAAAKQGIDIPCFCYHENLSIAGNCRMCLVEVENARNLVASCAMPIVNNMKIYTNTTRVIKAREAVLEFLLINHPLDCPICDQGGECDLQDITLAYGSDKSRFYEQAKRSVLNKNVGFFVKTLMNRCIHCTRCVRFFKEVVNIDNFGILNRGSKSEIGTYIESNLNNIFSGNVVDLCPVGALTSKEYAFKNRNWELSSFEYINIFDNFLNNLRVDVYNKNIVRILPLDNTKKSWITNTVRYSFEILKFNRLEFNYLFDKNTNEYSRISQGHFFFLFLTNIMNYYINDFSKLNIKLNSFLNYDDIFLIKNLLQNFGIQETNNLNLNFDFFDKFIFRYYTKKDTNILLNLGLSLRLEMPVDSLYILNNLKKNKLFLLNWGFDDYYTSTLNTTQKNYIFLGTRLNDIYAFLKGKGLILKKLVEINLKIYKIALFLNTQFDFVTNRIKKLLNTYYVYINYKDFTRLEFLNSQKTRYNKLNKYLKVKIAFLNSYEDLDIKEEKKNYNFLYNSSFFPKKNKKYELLNPYLNFFENFTNLRNVEGFLKRSDSFLNTEFTKKTQQFNNFFFFTSSYLKHYIINLFFITFYSIYNIQLKIYEKLLKSQINLKYNYNNSIYVNYNFLFNSTVFEYYSKNKLFLNIKVLSLASRNLLNNGFFNKTF